jgi:hypothetical protein
MVTTVTSTITSLTCGLEMRNGFKNAYLNSEQIRDERSFMNASGITGSATLMHTNTTSAAFKYMYAGSVLRNEEYIYFYNHKTDSNPFLGEICEYRISDGNKTYIQYASSVTSIARTINMAFIEGRKLLVYDEFYDVADTYYVYIVDFDDLSCTEVAAIPYQDGDIRRFIRCVSVIKSVNNDLHLFIIIDYDDPVSLDYGIELRYKDYSHGGAWITITKFIADEGGFTASDSDYTNQYLYTIVDNRYLIIPTMTTYTDGDLDDNYFHTFFVYDTNTGILDYDTWFAGEDTESNYPYIDYMQADETNNKVYFESQGYSTGHYAYCEFDPSTMTFAWKYDSPDSDGIKMLSTQQHAYAHDYHNDNNYQASTVGGEGACTLPVVKENTCSLMDDLNSLIWYWDNINNHIQAITMGNSIIIDVDPSITPGNTKSCILHMGDCLIVSTNNFSTTPSYCKYYLIL